MMSEFKKQIKEAIDKLTPEEIKEFFPEDNIPKGWVSIEEHLPNLLACDISQGYSEYKVKFKDGSEDISFVSDHIIWYHEAKHIGITHWFNK
jgi:hypothetical protein